MKITIEPTTNFAPEQHACTVAHVADDLNIDEVAELIKAALRGYGFHADTVDKLFSEE